MLVRQSTGYRRVAEADGTGLVRLRLGSASKLRQENISQESKDSYRVIYDSGAASTDRRCLVREERRAQGVTSKGGKPVKGLGKDGEDGGRQKGTGRSRRKNRPRLREQLLLTCTCGKTQSGGQGIEWDPHWRRRRRMNGERRWRRIAEDRRKRKARREIESFSHTYPLGREGGEKRKRRRKKK